VKTTRVFCRPGCSAKVPRRENVEFFPSAPEALHAGYRPCKRCKPLGPPQQAPEWVARVIDLAERHEGQRLTAADLRGIGIDPVKAARYFKSHYGMTFQAYHRARRLGRAMKHLRKGATTMTAGVNSGYDSGSGFRDAFADVFGVPPSRADQADARLLHAKWLETPLGSMLAIASDDGLCMLEFMDRRGLQTQLDTLRKRIPGVVVPGTNAHLDHIEREMAAYFEGSLKKFSVKLDAPGTDFQQRVWAALRKIPLGQTRSYADIARAIDAPTSVRAVARANGDNRIAVIIPCHRVIGSDGSLTGYAGGLRRKEWLLDHERSMTGSSLLRTTPAAISV
jgi:AraC family transcriptional regulator of adaptative response/methylated-DNA-[protein]-cysteine methyltransferase